MRLCVAGMPGCDREWRKSKICLRNCYGMNGCGVPVEVSQMRDLHELCVCMGKEENISVCLMFANETVLCLILEL